MWAGLRFPAYKLGSLQRRTSRPARRWRSATTAVHVNVHQDLHGNRDSSSSSTPASFGLDELARYIDGIPNGERITVRNLLGMTSGIYDFPLDREPAWKMAKIR